MSISNIWQVSINGGARSTCAALGMHNVKIERANFATSTCTFSIPMASYATAQPFSEGDAFALFREDVQWFGGTVTGIDTNGTPGRMEWVFTVSDAWYYLERIIYQQPRAVEYKSGTTWATQFQMTTRVALGQDFWGRSITIQQQINNILLYAGSKGAGGISIGSLGSGDTFPIQEAREITCAEAIRRCMVWLPFSTTQIYYTSGTPNISIIARAALSTFSLDLQDTAKQVVVENVNPRYDLNVPGVSFTFATTAQDVASPSGDGAIHTTYQTQTAGSPGAAGSVYATIEMENPASGKEESVPSNVAGRYYAAISGSCWQARVVVTELDCSLTAGTGYALNLTNGRSEWSTMNAVVQQVSIDIDNGETTFTCGAPNHISPQNFASFMQFLASKQPPSGMPNSNNNGTAGVGTGSEGSIPGVTAGGAATGVTPVTNNAAGKPKFGQAAAGAAAGFGSGGAAQFPYVDLTLCDRSQVRVVGFPL